MVSTVQAVVYLVLAAAGPMVLTPIELADDGRVYVAAGARDGAASGDTYELRCPTHGWTFDLEGHPTGIAEIYTPRYPLTVDGQVLRITVF